MKVRLLLKSYDQALLKEALEEVANALANSECQVAGAASLPMDISSFCVLRSPHVDKKSREHFEIRTYRKLVDVFVEKPDNLNILLRASLPAGVSCFLKLL